MEIGTTKSIWALAMDSFFLATGSFAAKAGMNNTTFSIDAAELADGSFLGADGRLQSVGVKPGYGSGCLSRAVAFQSGISMVIQDFSLYGQGEIRLSSDRGGPPVMEFFIGLSGIGQIHYAKPRTPLGDGFSNIAFPGYKPGLFMKVKRNTPIRVLSVYMAPCVFEKLTGKSRDELVRALDMIDTHTGKKAGPARSKQIDLAQNLCGYQALDSLMNNPCDTLFLEAKALEFIALQLRQLDHLTGGKPQSQAVDHHAEQISYACEILRKEMENPPKVLALARRVGLNHNHLIQGFKSMLGLSPFEYLRTIRLEKARQLIAGNECNVTQAAFRVGYSSPSHFSKAFRKEFGMNPKIYAAAGLNRSGK